MAYNIEETLLQHRGFGIEIDLVEAKLQSQSPLFRLPAELRQRIYEYVIGSGQIHITTRYCNPEDNPLIRISITYQDGPTTHEYKKLTYSTCRDPASFRARYALSQTPSSAIPVMYYNSQGLLPDVPQMSTMNTIVAKWGVQHTECGDAAQRDLFYQEYASQRCSVANRYVGHDDMNCAGCMEVRKILELEFGPPTAKLGLKKFHADSAVSVDGLLRSCRRVYGEARGLPFKLYTFDVGTEVGMTMFVETWLEHWQVESIEHLHVDCVMRALEEVGDVVEVCMPALKTLELDVSGDRAGEVNQVRARETGLEVEKVEVVVGVDKDCRVLRQDRRLMAKNIEEKLWEPEGSRRPAAPGHRGEAFGVDSLNINSTPGPSSNIPRQSDGRPVPNTATQQPEKKPRFFRRIKNFVKLKS